MPQEFTTPLEAAHRLAISQRTITKWCRAGKVPGAMQTVGGHWRVPADWSPTSTAAEPAANRVPKIEPEEAKP